MKKINYETLKNRKWDKTILNYIGLIHEYKGRQQMFLTQKKDLLDKLIEVAKRQSTEASNAIEGIATSSARLKKLLNSKTTPKNRNEKEILGYRHVLSLINENYESIPISPNYILQLHKEMYKFMDAEFGGKFKCVTNYIKDGNGNLLFTPVEPFLVNEYISTLCEEYNKIINSKEIDPLLVIPVFIHDYLCIHPFIDGNGRTSRLLTNMLLYQSGFLVGKYISLEKKIELTKSEYYSALQISSIDWHKNKNDDTEFVKYFLGILLSAYRDLEERSNLIEGKMSAFEQVSKAVNQRIGKFTKTDIAEMCPKIKHASVENSLKKLCESNTIKKEGTGSATYYIKVIS